MLACFKPFCSPYQVTSSQGVINIVEEADGGGWGMEACRSGREGKEGVRDGLSRTVGGDHREEGPP